LEIIFLAYFWYSVINLKLNNSERWFALSPRICYMDNLIFCYYNLARISVYTIIIVLILGRPKCTMCKKHHHADLRAHYFTWSYVSDGHVLFISCDAKICNRRVTNEYVNLFISIVKNYLQLFRNLKCRTSVNIVLFGNLLFVLLLYFIIIIYHPFLLYSHYPCTMLSF